VLKNSSGCILLNIGWFRWLTSEDGEQGNISSGAVLEWCSLNPGAVCHTSILRGTAR
jgi:hypothetical protein